MIHRRSTVEISLEKNPQSSLSSEFETGSDWKSLSSGPDSILESKVKKLFLLLFNSGKKARMFISAKSNNGDQHVAYYIEERSKVLNPGMFCLSYKY